MSPTERIVPIIGIICAYLLVLTVSKIEIKKNWTKVIILFFTIVGSYIIIKIGSLDRTWFLTSKKLIVSLLFLSITIYLYINSKKTRNYYLLSILLIITGLINLALVNPVNRGTGVLHNSKTAKEIQKIVKKDKDAKWISIDSIFLGNYVIANGGKSINSTNIYPNIDLWKKIDKDDSIYNRFAHVIIELTNEENKFELVQQDIIKLYLNYNYLDDLDIKYLITNKELDIIEDYKDKIKIIYNYDNIWIYNYSE